jgi:ADP-ribose pyrophosphatase YjhB (NUDIX family)
MSEQRKNSFCSYCGGRFAPEQAWPRTCAACGNISYVNPAPVGVALLPVDDGLLCVRRGIEPGIGELSLPGGFLDVGETWQEGCVRELREETGIVVEAGRVLLFQTLTAREGFLLVFGLLPRLRSSDLPPFVACEEVLAWEVAKRPIELLFWTHTQAMREFFEGRQGVALEFSARCDGRGPRRVE